jgi:signal peptidase
MSDDSRGRLRLAANVLVALVLLAVVVPFVVYAVPQVVGADHGMVVLSGSMEPKMSPGDAVIVREVGPSEIDRRDVITFQRPGSETPTTHRVIEIRQTDEGEAYVTKGDANEDPDTGTVTYDRVVGEVIFVIPFIGYLIRFANTQLGFLALVLTPMVLFVASELWELATSIGGTEERTAVTDGNGGSTVAPGSATASAASTPATQSTGASSTATDSDDDGGFTLTRSSLQLLAFLLGIYVPYSAYVAYTVREAWTIAAATATVVGFLFCLVIYVASFGGSDDRTPVSRSLDIDALVRPGELPKRIGNRTTIPLDSVESLARMAADGDDWVLHDEHRDTYHLARDDALYLHRAAPETDGGRDAPDDAPTSADGGEGT